jgi:pyrroloquinoline quinone (PQQ) biosynthesis protein C
MAFHETLLAEARSIDMRENRFVQGVMTGAYQRADLAPYATTVFHLADHFPMMLGRLIGICPSPEVRASLVENIIEEEGLEIGTDDGHVAATRHPARRHAAVAKVFAEAAGVEAEALQPRPFHVSRWLADCLSRGRWMAAFAYVSLGLEGNVPRTCKLLVPAFRTQYGFTDRELSFFIHHIEADEHHGEEAALAIASMATTPAAREEALEGARHGGHSWWHVHEACHRAIAGRAAVSIG